MVSPWLTKAKSAEVDIGSPTYCGSSSLLQLIKESNKTKIIGYKVYGDFIKQKAPLRIVLMVLLTIKLLGLSLSKFL